MFLAACLQDPLEAQQVIAEVGVGGYNKLHVRGCELRVARAEGGHNWKVGCSKASEVFPD